MPAIDMHDPAVGRNHAAGASPSDAAPPGETPLGETPPPPPGLLVADLFSQGPAYRSRRRAGTRDWLITFTIGGRGRYRLGGREFACTPGDAMLLQPGTPHDYGTDPLAGRWDFYWAHFLPRPAWSPWLLWPELAPGLRKMSIGDATSRARLAEIFDRLLCDISSLATWGARLAENALEEAILLIAQEHERTSRQTADPRVATVLQELGRRYREPLTVAELAAAVSLSPSRLAHLFREVTGNAPMRMLLRLRLRQGARLLEYSTLSVAEIAAEVGFESPFYFSRQFRAEFGVSPTAYRSHTSVHPHALRPS